MRMIICRNWTTLTNNSNDFMEKPKAWFNRSCRASVFLDSRDPKGPIVVSSEIWLALSIISFLGLCTSTRSCIARIWAEEGKKALNGSLNGKKGRVYLWFQTSAYIRVRTCECSCIWKSPLHDPSFVQFNAQNFISAYFWKEANHFFGQSTSWQLSKALHMNEYFFCFTFDY